jgi:DinB family protein
MTAIEAELEQLTADLTESQFQAPPRTGGWSVGHCLEHLILTGNAFLARWDAALATPKNGRRIDGPFTYSWWWRSVLQFADAHSRLKVKTTRAFVPCSRRPKDDTVRRFLRMHRDVEQRLRACEGVDTKRIKVPSPFISWIQFPLGVSFDLVLAHERRHLWQARQVREQLAKQSE